MPRTYTNDAEYLRLCRRDGWTPSARDYEEYLAANEPDDDDDGLDEDFA